MDFPLMLYKRGSMFEWDGETFDYLIVADADEAKDAKAEGWSIDKPSAEKAAPAEKPDLSALRAQYKAKHGKSAFNGWDADKLREKLAALG